MGIYDRQYIRDTPPRGRGAAARSAMSMWSVNTWLILICVAVYVVDGFLPKSRVRVMSTVPAQVQIDNHPRYKHDARLAIPGLPPDQEVWRIVDVQTGQAVGIVQYVYMPPMQRWLHFSTSRTFLRPFQVFEFWRFIGFQFLHGSFGHLLFNMLGLFFFGPLVERYLGRKRYLAFYLLCGIFGALMYLALNLGGFVASSVLNQSVRIPGLLFNSPDTPLVGASAGVFGVIMAGAYLAPNAKVLLFFIVPMPLKVFAYGLVVIAFVTVMMEGNNAGGEAGHLGGALAGFYFIRKPHHLHGFFDIIGRADPTSHHYRGRRGAGARAAPDRTEIDRILDKINAKGLSSLTPKEKKILRESSKG